MAKASGTKSPATILVLGFLVIAVMAGVVSWLSNTKPIIKLVPALEKVYNARGFKCWLKLNEGRIEVEPPAGLALDRLGRRRLGAVALAIYLKLASYQSSVESAVVLSPKGSGLAAEEISSLEMQLLGTGETAVAKLAEDASIASGSSATLVLVAPGYEGVAVVLDVGEADEASGRRAASTALKVSFVSFARAIGRSGWKPIEMGRELRIFGTAPVTSPATPWDPLESTCRHASLSIL